MRGKEKEAAHQKQHWQKQSKSRSVSSKPDASKKRRHSSKTTRRRRYVRQRNIGESEREEHAQKPGGFTAFPSPINI